MKLLSEKYFPGIHNFGWHAEAENMKWFQWKQIWKWGERNTSLEFISLRSCSADFDLNLEAVAVILSEKTNNSQQSTCTGGLRKLSHGGKWFRRHISRPLHFSHPLTGAYRTRLSIRRQDPNNYSDTETRTLSTLRCSPKKMPTEVSNIADSRCSATVQLLHKIVLSFHNFSCDIVIFFWHVGFKIPAL